MKILVIAAMDKEIALLKSHMKGCSEMQIEGNSVYEGSIGHHQVILAKCGIGKVNSALRTWQLLEEYTPDLVINSGVAGGADVAVPIAGVVIADGVGYHDVWCGPGTVPGQADGQPALFDPWVKGLEIAADMRNEDPNVYIGTIASGDIFISKPEEIEKIKSIYPAAIACDMESASIAHTCHVKGVPFLIIRVVSDMPGSGNNLSEYTNFWSEAPERTFRALEKMLERI